jgi:hypothetical protein
VSINITVAIAGIGLIDLCYIFVSSIHEIVMNLATANNHPIQILWAVGAAKEKCC